jgi:hypothetical protein
MEIVDLESKLLSDLFLGVTTESWKNLGCFRKETKITFYDKRSNFLGHNFSDISLELQHKAGKI